MRNMIEKSSELCTTFVEKGLLWAVAGLALLYFPAQSAAAPKIGSPQPEFKFGDRESGTEVNAAFTITNSGDQPLEISKVLPGCGCTSAKISQKTIPPGSQATITAILSLKLQKGDLRKDVLVESNDPTNPHFMLYMVGKAVLPIRVTPDKLILGQINAHAGGERTIDLVAPNPDKKFHITGVDVGDKESLAVRYEEVQKDMAYRIHLTIGKQLTPGDYHSFVRIRTSNPQFNVLGIAVTATVVGELTVKPSEIKIYDPKDKAGTTREITIVPAKVQTFKVTGVESPDPSVKVETIAEDHSTYRIRVSGLKPSKSLDGKKIIVKTDATDMATIRIPLHVVNMGHPPHEKQLGAAHSGGAKKAATKNASSSPRPSNG